MHPRHGLAHVDFYGWESVVGDSSWEWGARGGRRGQAFSLPCLHPMTTNPPELPAFLRPDHLIPPRTVNLVAFCFLPRSGDAARASRPTAGRAGGQPLAHHSAKDPPATQLMYNTGGPVPGVHINSLSQPAWSLRTLPSPSRASPARGVRTPLPWLRSGAAWLGGKRRFREGVKPH